MQHCVAVVVAALMFSTALLQHWEEGIDVRRRVWPTNDTMFEYCCGMLCLFFLLTLSFCVSIDAVCKRFTRVERLRAFSSWCLCVTVIVFFLMSLYNYCQTREALSHLHMNCFSDCLLVFFLSGCSLVCSGAVIRNVKVGNGPVSSRMLRDRRFASQIARLAGSRY